MPSFITRLTIKLRMLFGRRKAAEQLDSELSFHLEQQISENIAAGMSPAEARKAALRIFGSPDLAREQARATWSWTGLDHFLLDLRLCIRGLRRAPGFSAVVILVLALGIGANVALFSVVHSVLLNALPFHDSGRLVRVFEADSRGRYQDNIVAGGSFAVWKEQQKSFVDLAIKRSAGYDLAGGLSGSGSKLPEYVHAEIASWNLFPLLGIQSALGRLFTADDDHPGANGTVVLSWSLWKRRYAGDPAILGKTIELDARPFTVIGILPEWFQYPDAKIQLWTPLYHEKSAEMMRMVEAHNFDVIGRLKPGITPAQATADLSAIQAEVRRQHPSGPVSDAVNLRPILDAEVRGVKSGLYALLAATGCLLLIACLNIASLFIARSAARQRETAVRTALGGSRLRLMRNTLLESLLLSSAGGLAGLVLAAIGLRWLVAVRTDIPRAENIHLDGWALLLALGVVFLCAALSGLVPALAATDRNILRSLQANTRTQAGSIAGVRLRRSLLALEVGLTVVLLVGSGLLLKTYQRLRSANPGCATRDVLTMELALPKGKYNTDIKRVAFAETLTQRLSEVRGISAGLTTQLPAEGVGRNDTFSIQEHPPLPLGQTLTAVTVFVDPGYFSAMQIPLISGRLFQPDDRFDHGQSVLINESLARRDFPNENPIGKHLFTNVVSLDPHPLEIIGVVGDTRADIAAPPEPTFYFPLYLGSERGLILTMRTRSDASSIALTAQKIIAGIDPDLPVSNILTMDQVIGEATLAPSFDAALLISFAILSLVLAAVGLFGVLSFLVSQRTSEIGIRLALGAERGQITRLMLADGLKPALFGLALGLVASAAATHLMQSLLYGTQPLDPAIFTAVAITLVAVAAGACLLPALRASRLDPMQALRTE
ncbi:ADOP family duplicated permease [Acidicapsa dinghuensis]|uniref:ADOP family duplicated permease n=1 Tax=Acidicapsa dinghuensis TaxID=2218256 RepID=A0ABW1EB26_9BACT|nr:ABC transporter permease [Acidicapsa dinghuensis]